MVVTHAQPALAAFLCSRIGLVPSPHLVCLGSVVGDELLGVIGYDGFNGTSVQMHVAGEGHWLHKSVLKAAFDYPFNVMGCQVVLGLVPSGNAAAIRLNTHLGFKTINTIEGAHPDGALLLMTMTRAECRWLRLPAKIAGMH